MLLTKESVANRSPLYKQVDEHPFLIVRKSDYPDLQAKALCSPWREQREDALHDARSVIYTPTARIDVRSITLARILSTTALAYVIDPGHRPHYLKRIVEHLRPFDPDEPGSITAEMRATPDKIPWKYGVPTGNAFFQAVLALDIIHDDLPENERTRIEQMLRSGPALYFAETKLAWRQGSLAAKAIWPIYERNAAVYGPIVDEWRSDVLGSISADGVFGGGTGYADARWTFADREHKAQFGEILAHTGILPDWYDQPRLRHFQEWLTGYAYTPFKVLWTFGDGAPGMFFGQYQPGPERAYRYSDRAGRYSAWLRGDAALPAGLASYVLANKVPGPAEAAPSRIFPDGGAWLKESTPDAFCLAGALWNLKTLHDAHAHKETNSLCLAAYGELVLRGSGYNGWGTGEKGFSWTYIHDRALSANTVLYDYAVPETAEQERDPGGENDHVRKVGAGVTTGLITGVVDYALGDSGDAIPNGKHLRNFFFIHPSDGVCGYFAVVDELTSSKPGMTGHVVWHPASAACVETTRDAEYTWTMREFGPSDVSFTLFLGTPPDRTRLRDGVLSNWEKGIVGKYLVADYGTGAAGRQSAVTVLFPHNAGHPKATFSRIRGDGFSGAVVCQNGVIDRFFESDGSTAVSGDAGLCASARAGYSRRSRTGELVSVWLKDMTRAAFDGTTITSTSPVTVFYRDGRLHVVATESVRVMLSLPGLNGVSVEGHETAVSAAASASVGIDLPVGTTIVTASVDGPK